MRRPPEGIWCREVVASLRPVAEGQQTIRLATLSADSRNAVSELTTIPTAELAELRQRLSRLAREKAQLQLIALLMNRLGELPGLERAVEGMLRFVMDILGGLNVTVYYRLEGALHCVDVHGRQEVLSQVDDELVRQVFETRELVSRERDLAQAGGAHTGRATTWVMPLVVGAELVGVLRMDDLLVAGRELREEVQTFLRYASLVLKNEISGETRLRQAFDEVGRANRAEAALAERHSTLRGILEGTPSPIFSLDRELRYVAFNRSHASAMRALYGAEIEVGHSLLGYMTVADDRETARANLERALAGEHLVTLAQSGDEQHARRYFEVAHHPVRRDDGQVIGVAVFADDVTERRRAEEERRANLWIAESLDQVNRAIQGARDLEQMMSEVLGAALAIFGCDRAFLLYPCDPDTASYRVPMERTRPEFPGALARGLDVPVDAESAQVLRAARASAGPVTFDPASEPPLPRLLAERFGVQSQIAMAVLPRAHEPYLFGLHQCSGARVWTPEERRLFEHIGRRLSDALASLLARRDLQDSEQRYRRITEGLTDYLYSVRVEGGRAVETRQNPACAAVTGYSAEEFAADPQLWIRMVPPEERELVRERAAQILSGAETPPLEHRIVRKDGAVRWVCDTTIPLRDASGRLLSYDGVIKDVTERKQAEEALRDERGLFVGGPTVVFKWRAQEGWPVEYVSPNVADQLGYAVEDLTSGKVPYASIVHPEDLARVAAEVSAYSAQGLAAFEQTYRLARPDGRYVWVDDFTTVIRRRDGTVTHFLGYVLDVTERKQAALDLARANRALRMLSDSNQALVRITDEATLLDEICRIAVEMGGYRMAWVGLAEHDAARTVRPVAHAGQESGYLASAGVTWGDDEHGRGPSGTAIRTGRPSIAREILTDPAFAPWREAALQRGYSSIIALPLVSAGQALGVLGIYSAEANAFDANEVAILEELASDLAFGLAALRTQAQRDQVEEALQKSEERYRTLIQRIRAGVVVHDADSRVLASNALAQELLGLTEAQMLGKTALDPAWRFLREDGTSMPADEYPVSQVLATRRALRDFVVGAHRPPAAGDVWLLVNADPVAGRAGEIAQVVVTFVDITARKHMEEALHRREAELNESQRLAHIGSWEWDAVNDTTWWSAEHYQIYGLDPAQPAPNYVEHLGAYTPESAERVRALVARALETGEPYEVDLELARPTASTRWVVARGEAKRDAAGRIAGLRGTAQNITERKRLEEEMRRSAAAIEQAAETIVITDPSAEIEYVNPAFTAVTGYSRDEAVGRRPSLWTSGRHDQEFYRRLWATLLRGETWRGHLINKRKDGSLFEEDATISPVRDERGRVVHYVAVKRDVTQEVALEAQLRESQKMEAIGRLAGGVAHDFNNLLQAMFCHAELLRMTPDNAEAELVEMEAQIRRGAALTRQLLLFSRREEARRERLDVNEVIVGAGRLLRRLVKENVALSIELDKGGVTVEADRGQLEQVLMNLTINAADAMPAGGRLSIRTGCAGALAFFAVEDTGCGIPEAIRPKVFEPLFTTKPAGHGTGLGLSVVHGIVSQHGGRIELESREGVGTTVRVLLPRLPPEESPRAPQAGAEDASAAGHGERILVVEDQAGARVGLRAVLRSLGYEAVAVGSGAEAEALPGEPAFDALLTDLMLPDVEGTELARGLRERWPGLRVVLMSGYTEADVLARAGGLGKVRFLQKPFDSGALARVLRQVLSEGPQPA